MSTRFKHYVVFMAGLCISLGLSTIPVQAESYTLVGRAKAGHMELSLDKTQWEWIRKKGELVLGTSAPDYPPFDLTLTGRDYEGFTADYAGIISKALDVPIKVQRFKSREAAISALGAAKSICWAAPMVLKPWTGKSDSQHRTRLTSLCWSPESARHAH